MAKSHPEDKRSFCRFHPCNEILMRLYEIFETDKKQELTPFMTPFSIDLIIIGKLYIFLIVFLKN